MPHVLFSIALQVCPWPGCGHRIEMIDFRLELYGDPGLYSRVVSGWWDPGYGVIAPCPGCGQHGSFRHRSEKGGAKPDTVAFEVLRSDWHTIAFIQELAAASFRLVPRHGQDLGSTLARRASEGVAPLAVCPRWRVGLT